MSEPDNSPLLIWAKSQFLAGCPEMTDLIRAVCALPGMANWAPTEEVPIRNAMPVFHILLLGMVLTRIDDPSFEPVLKSVAASLRERGVVDRDDAAELITAAVVRPWCDRVVYIPRSNERRSTDLVATANGQTIEIEVTTAERKEEQERRQQTTSELQNKLRALPLDRHIVVYYVDALTDDEQRSIIEAASRLEVGQAMAAENRWHVTIEPPQESPIYNAVSSTPAPSWFPEQSATPASLSATVQFGEGVAKPTASAQVRWGLSTKSYLNPLSKKAERHQGSEGSPFFIAIDVTRLPGAEEWYASELQGYWEQWPHVSGVLLFRGPAWVAGIALTVFYKVLLNPHADRPLKAKWVSGKWEWPFA